MHAIPDWPLVALLRAARVAGLFGAVLSPPTWAQADGTVTPVNAAPWSEPTPEHATIAPVGAPGAALMNNLQHRMRLMQQTQDPALRQRRSEEFLRTLQTGMHQLGKPDAAPPASLGR